MDKDTRQSLVLLGLVFTVLLLFFQAPYNSSDKADLFASEEVEEVIEESENEGSRFQFSAKLDADFGNILAVVEHPVQCILSEVTLRKGELQYASNHTHSYLLHHELIFYDRA